jgi:uncharacterized protein with PIN domain
VAVRDYQTPSLELPSGRTGFRQQLRRRCPECAGNLDDVEQTEVSLAAFDPPI